MSDINLNRRSTLKALGAGLLTAGSFSGSATAHKGGLKGELAEVRSATAKYNDPANAYADGFMAFGESGPIPLEDVVSEAESICGMGFHFANFDNFGTYDRLKPQVLVYGVDDDGDLILGAVEYIIPDEITGGNPDLFTHDDGEEHWDAGPFPGVHSLHVWVHTHNPDGVFNHTNPRKQFSPDGCLNH
ncbi:hypothetical protein [Halorubrum sp. HHNYT27]|uniref:hypothetical protein n=1 Tax=Halorubrum sp. HHNYT27 TaxID=3402275 RepID=UPI003EBD87BE